MKQMGMAKQISLAKSLGNLNRLIVEAFLEKMRIL